MWDVLLDSILDTLKLFPFLFLIYIIIELLEHKTDLMGAHSRLNSRLGPLLGSATGLIPQCGFSVMAAKLFEQKYITMGTLLAIFLSTSDEAFVLLLSSGTGAIYLLPLIVVKLIVGLSVGYLVDGISKVFTSKKDKEITNIGNKEEVEVKDIFIKKSIEEHEFECNSCGREHDESKPFKVYFVSPLLHSLQVALFIFLVNFALGTIFYYVGEDSFMEFMTKNAGVQPFITALVGLIPNCASSVVITECFLKNGILFGSCVGGLCANAGLGFVVLLKNTKKWKRNLFLVLLCYLISVLVGFIVNALTFLIG